MSDPDALAALEAERDFLLRSIDDLDAEAAAGNLDAERHSALRDEYTARAAAVLRSIAVGVDASPVAPPLSWRRRGLVAGGIVAFAAAAGLLLAQALGDRLPGQTATGNAQSGDARAGGQAGSTDGDRPTGAAQRAALEAAVAAAPDDPEAHLDLARFLLSVDDAAGAVKAYDDAARLGPDNAEARAYAGWVVYLVTQQDAFRGGEETAAPLIDGAMRRLDEAVAIAPDYPDAHFFRGAVLLRARNDPAGAATEFERYLALAPEGAFTNQVGQLLDLARRQAGDG